MNQENDVSLMLKKDTSEFQTLASQTSRADDVLKSALNSQDSETEIKQEVNKDLK